MFFQNRPGCRANLGYSVYALRALLNSLATLVGYEAHEGQAVTADWASSATASKMSEWRDKGMQLKEEMERIAEETSAQEYARIMHEVRFPSGNYAPSGDDNTCVSGIASRFAQLRQRG